MPMLSSWWSKISVLKRVLIALVLVSTLLSAGVYLFGGRLASFALRSFVAERSKEELQETPFSRQAWHCEYGAHLDVTTKDGKVIEAAFSEEY